MTSFDLINKYIDSQIQYEKSDNIVQDIKGIIESTQRYAYSSINRARDNAHQATLFQAEKRTPLRWIPPQTPHICAAELTCRSQPLQPGPGSRGCNRQDILFIAQPGHKDSPVSFQARRQRQGSPDDLTNREMISLDRKSVV